MRRILAAEAYNEVLYQNQREAHSPSSNSMLRHIKDFLTTNTGTGQTIIKNSFWLLVGEVAGRLLKMLLVAYAARAFGAEGWGLFSYALSLTSLFMVFSDTGLSMLVTREASAENPRKDAYLATASCAKALLLFASLAAAVFLAPHASSMPGARALIPAIALFLVFDSLKEFLFALKRSEEKMEHEGIFKVVISIMVAAAGFALLQASASPQNLALAYLAGTAAGVALILATMRRTIRKLMGGFSRTVLKSVWRAAWPMGLSALLASIMINMDMIMLAWWRTPEDIGLYAAAQRLVQFLYVIPIMFTAALFPILSKRASGDKNEFGAMVGKAARGVLLFALPLAAGGALLGSSIMQLVFGSEYARGAGAFAILLCTVLPVFPNMVLARGIYAQDKQRHLVLPAALSLGMNALFNAMLIPRFGIAGAALTTVISQLLISLSSLAIMRKTAPVAILPDIMKTSFSLALMAACAVALNALGMHVLLIIAFSACAYGASLAILGEPTARGAIRAIIRANAR